MAIAEQPAVIGYYRIHGALTEPGRFAVPLAAFTDLAGLCAFIQGVVIHSDWASAYGVTADLSRGGGTGGPSRGIGEGAGGGGRPPARRA
ncbi:MAG: hypothetical protein ACHQPH_25660, partial [Reyranellales bacterium]